MGKPRRWIERLRLVDDRGFPFDEPDGEPFEDWLRRKLENISLDPDLPIMVIDQKEEPIE